MYEIEFLDPGLFNPFNFKVSGIYRIVIQKSSAFLRVDLWNIKAVVVVRREEDVSAWGLSKNCCIVIHINK